MGRGSRTALRASHGSRNDSDRAPRRRVIVIQRNTQRPGVTLPSPNAQDHPTPNAHCPSGTQRSQYRVTYGPLDRAPLAPGDLAAAAIWHPTQHPTPCDHSTPVETWHTVPDNSNRHGSPARGRPCLRVRIGNAQPDAHLPATDLGAGLPWLTVSSGPSLRADGGDPASPSEQEMKRQTLVAPALESNPAPPPGAGR